MSRIHRILFPTDLSESSGWAYAYAARLAAKFSAELYALHVRLPSHGNRHAETPPVMEGDEFCLPLVEGLTETVEEVDAASVPRAIVRYAEGHDVDLIVMGARGRSGADLPDLGHVAEAVVRYASCPVLTVRDRMRSTGLRRILVPVDFSEPCRTAVTQARWVAAWFGAQLDLLHVVPDAGRRAHVPRCAEAIQARLFRFAVAAAGPDVVMVAHVGTGEPAEEIVAHVERLHADLIVMGTRGEERERGEMGSVAEAVVHAAPCPVLAVKERAHKVPAEPKAVARPFPVAG
ncbi:MAG: universal stress protein [Rhodothermales bacterium]